MKIFGIAAVAVMAGVAGADTVNVSYLGTGSGLNVKITGPGEGGPEYLHVFSGQLRHNIAGPVSWAGEQKTFCVEIAEHAGSGTDYSVKSLSKLPGEPNPLPGYPVGSTGMGEDRAKAIAHLYDAANGAQFGTDAVAAAAFQVAVWELTFDFDDGVAGDGLGLGGGNFRLHTDRGSGTSVAQYDSMVAQIGDWLTYVTSNYASTPFTPLLGLSHDGRQDQVVMVPLPAPVAMGLAGLLAVAGVRRLRAR